MFRAAKYRLLTPNTVLKLKLPDRIDDYLFAFIVICEHPIGKPVWNSYLSTNIIILGTNELQTWLIQGYRLVSYTTVSD